ncbi:MAG TPA: DUF5683 domain-containing protein [Chitinophagaceae bacterium]|nr:DUF5683 domain-containing protein [Chitinophagaceae bacterium]
MKRSTGHSFISALLIFTCLLQGFIASAQHPVPDSGEVRITADTIVPSQKKQAEPFNPRKATIRSAILPGWGQVYNKKYWKVPIVYSALGITGYIFADNIKTYKESRDAYRIRHNYSQPTATADDTTAFNALEQIYKIAPMESIRHQRDRFRQYIDYSVIFFVIFWGLNVVDATVDAHLKNFDVSPDLSLKIKAGRSEMAGTNGLSLVLHIGKTKPAALLPGRF